MQVCNICQFKKLCKHKRDVELLLGDIDEIKKEYDVVNLLKIEATCKEFKEEEF